MCFPLNPLVYQRVSSFYTLAFSLQILRDLESSHLALCNNLARTSQSSSFILNVSPTFLFQVEMSLLSCTSSESSSRQSTEALASPSSSPRAKQVDSSPSENGSLENHRALRDLKSMKSSTTSHRCPASIYYYQYFLTFYYLLHIL